MPGNPNTQAGFSPTGNVILPSSFGSTPTAYLIGGTASSTTWNYWDPFTGKLVRSIVNASTPGLLAYPKFIDGSELAYGTKGTFNNNTLYRWNITKVVNNNWPTGIEWQIQLPASMIDAFAS